MLLTIAIPTYNRSDVLFQTLDSVLRLMNPEDMELIVVDQCPPDDPERKERMLKYAGRESVRVITEDRASLTGARNTAIREARAPVVLFLDDDVLIPDQLFAQHLRSYRDPQVSAVTGQVYNCLDPDHPPPLSHPERNTRRHSNRHRKAPARNISGGNHSVRKVVARSIGGYDEAFQGSALGEDMDFSQRLIGAGFHIQYNPDAWIIHLGVRSGGCAVDLKSGWMEWQHSGSLMTYAFRHSFRQHNFGRILRMALRNGPLRKEVVIRPYLWPMAWWGFVRGCWYGWRHRRFVSVLRDES